MDQQLARELVSQTTEIGTGTSRVSLEHRGTGLFDFSKRVFDLAASLILLLLAMPLFAVVSLLVAMDGGPVFFRHQRVGRDGRKFGCWKFRTMILDAEASLAEYLAHHPEAAAEWQRDQKLVYDPRVTPIGKFLRSSSLDELPQLFNVVAGEMSLVGPRPVTASELSRYGAKAGIYASVRPGITGLWQVSGRNETTYDERVSLDERYIVNRHVGMDLAILWRTIGVVFSGKGAR